MYAVIRAGGKQYRVAPGDVIRVERQNGSNGQVEFSEVLAVSGGEGKIGKPHSEARVVGQVVEQGRGKKILVFHYKRKKQYKKLRGHRQDFTAVRITEIAFDGQKFTAPALPKKELKPKKAAQVAPVPGELELPIDSDTIDEPTKRGKKSPTKKSVAKKAAPKKKK
ncbi:MAG TPA: 50S ribosomal protein L21 [Terriglobales bacterium]